MAEQDPTPNPFAAAPTDRPFAGRQAIITRIHQHITGRPQAAAPIIIGRQHSGKSALLHRFSGFVNDTIIGVYLPLSKIKPAQEQQWTQALIHTTAETLDKYNFQITSAQIPDEADVDTLKAWFKADYLPAVYRAIRRQRRLVFLLDDSEHLQLPEAYTYLYTLCDAQCAIVLTTDVAYDDNLTQFAPLVDETLVFRLNNLNEEEGRDLLKAAQITLDDDAHTLVMQASGGQPDILAAFGYFLYPLRGEVLSIKQVKQVQKEVYTAFEPDFHNIWKTLSLDERLILTAISSLHYTAPLREITIERLESWLIETDYPLDVTTIRATIRSLEYRELVGNTTEQAVQIIPGLMERWLLDNARLTEETPDKSLPRWSIIAVVLLVAVVLITLVVIAQDSQESNANDAIPTLTLAP